MIIVTFIVYFLLFIFIFSYPGLKNREKSGALLKFLAIPAILGIVVTFLSAVKVYFIYKVFLLLFGLVAFLLTYWQWGEQLRRWWH